MQNGTRQPARHNRHSGAASPQCIAAAGARARADAPERRRPGDRHTAGLSGTVSAVARGHIAADAELIPFSCASIATIMAHGTDPAMPARPKHRAAALPAIRPAASSHTQAPSALCPAPPTSAPAGVNERSRTVAPGNEGRTTNVVSDWLNSRATARICASSRPSASGTSDSGLPVSGRVAKTSTKEKGTRLAIGTSSQHPACLRKPRTRPPYSHDRGEARRRIVPDRPLMPRSA